MNRPARPAASAPAAPPSDPAGDGGDPEQLQTLLDDVPAPLEPLDVMALDGYLCGVLLQPRPLTEAQWWPFVLDLDGRAAPPRFDATALREAVRARHAFLRRMIEARRWFDPWVYELDEAASPSETVLSWVAGFATAMECFPFGPQIDEAQLIEPLALLYRHLDPDDLEDAEQLIEEIESLEPPVELADAVEELVRAVLLMADVTRPQAAAVKPGPRRPGPAGGGRAGPGRGPRSRSGPRA